MGIVILEDETTMEIERNLIVIGAQVDDSDLAQALYEEIDDQVSNMAYWELLLLKDFLDKHMSNQWNIMK